MRKSVGLADGFLTLSGLLRFCVVLSLRRELGFLLGLVPMRGLFLLVRRFW